MCIIIDTNCLASVFKENTSDHREFKPLFEWIDAGSGKIVYGGTKYLSELARAGRHYRGVLMEFSKMGKTVVVDRDTVDSEERRIARFVDRRGFDDAHLAAIVAASGCRLVCSKDKSADRFLTDSSIYPKGVRAPKIYRQGRHSHLLCDKNIARVCKDCARG